MDAEQEEEELLGEISVSVKLKGFVMEQYEVVEEEDLLSITLEGGKEKVADPVALSIRKVRTEQLKGAQESPQVVLQVLNRKVPL